MNKTYINESKLEEWCRSCPDHETFLVNFFSTCKIYEFQINLPNFAEDIKKYNFPTYLLPAFSDIAMDYRNVH